MNQLDVEYLHFSTNRQREGPDSDLIFPYDEEKETEEDDFGMYHLQALI